jgi:HK97 family phage major capsid protein/HK97 family phage prohead protease
VDRAFTLDIKSLDPDRRTFTGIASTPALDRQGHILDPAGITFTNPVPLLLHHDQKSPVGWVTLRAAADGIYFDAVVSSHDEGGRLKDRLDEAWHSVKAGVIKTMSVGWRPIGDAVERLHAGATKFLRSEIFEVSMVSIPANPQAVILSHKSVTKEPTMTIAERIQGLTQTRADLGQQMRNLMESAPAGSTLDESTAATVDEIKLKIKNCEADETRWRDMEAVQMTKATAVTSPYSHVSVTENVEPGIKLARYVLANIGCKYMNTDAVTYAQNRWGNSTPDVVLALKAAVAAGTTTDATWAKPLVNPSITADFLPLLRAATIIGKIAGLRKVPFNVNVPAQTAGGVVSWVGELKPKPVTAMAFAMENLPFNKVAAIVVLSQELVRFSNPSAEAVVRDSLVKDIAAYLDAQFINPAVAAVAGVNPASITNGAPTAAATTNPLADIMGLINHFATNNIPVDGLTFILSPSNALALSFRTNLDGSPEFPGIGINGGSYKGLQFITSNTVTTNVIALQPQYIMMADDGGVTIDASTEASLQMDSAPVSPVVDTTVLVSMFQMNAVALRAERYITWKRIGTNTVKYLTATAWPSPTGTMGENGDEPTTTRSKRS